MTVSVETRRCPRCEVTRPLSDFARDASKASGHKSHCKACDRAKAKRYYAGHSEQVIARVLERRGR